MKELTITASEWKKYKDKLRRISEKAADQMQAYSQSHSFQMDQEMIDYAYALATKYGEASAELACQMYDELAVYWNAQVPPAEPAATATYQEVSKAMNGCMKQSPSGNLISGVADRLVKQAGADTTIKNAIRDGAYWAWIPTGDTCAFCITLASRGWQKASKKVLKGDHAEHIHSHCDCTFAIAFREEDTEKYPFYDPDKYYQQYIDANGNINELRRKMYPDIAEARNARRRELYDVKTRMPGGDVAYIPDKKITDYFLKEGTPHFQEFADAGYSIDNSNKLKDDMLKGVLVNKATKLEGKFYGDRERYSVNIMLGNDNNKKRFVTIWQIVDGTPVLITAHRAKKVK